jgi:hypothetical protein
VDCCDVFHLVFLFYFFIFQNYICWFFLILSWLRIEFCNFFSLKHCWLLQCFSAWFIFLQNYLFFLFYFLILSWLKITVTICEESTVTYFENYCSLLQCFFPHGFFYNFFSNYHFQFYFFNIKLFVNYNYKSLQIRLNHVEKHCSFHHKTLWIATVFPTWFFFLFFVFVLLFFFLKFSLSIFF